VQTLNFVLDTQSPAAPTLALGTGVANGATNAEATAAGGVVTVVAESGASTVVSFSRIGGGTVSKTVTGTGAAQAVVLSSAELATLGDGSISVSAVATDAASNASSAGTSSFTLDTGAPTLSSGTAPSTALSTVVGTAGNGVGETITLTVTFDGNVNGLTSGNDSTIFKVAGTGVTATWGGVAGSNARTLTYTVQAGHNGQASIDEAALKTALIAGVSDAAGNAFTYTANSGTIANIDAAALPVIDTLAPTLSSGTAPSTALSTVTGTAGNSAGETITLTVTFDGNVNGFTSGNDSTIFKVAGTGVLATWGGRHSPARAP